MAKQKAKTVDMSVSEEDLAKIELPEEAEKRRVKEIEEAEKAEKAAKKAAKTKKKEAIEEKIEAKAEEVKVEKKTLHQRSKKYNQVHTKVDRSKNYDLKSAVDLVKKTSYTKFAGTVVADIIAKDQKVTAEIAFPHATGRTVKVAIASDEILAQIEKGVIDFDLLVTTPLMMPKIAKFAKILGPKGLMPNPKNQTVVADPEKRQKELEAGKVTIRPEKKAPLIHVAIGKTDMPDKALVANLESLINGLGAKRIVKLVVSATMSPGIKVDITPFQT